MSVGQELSGIGELSCIGIPIRLMNMSSQSENEWSSTLISISDGPGINDEPLTSQDAVSFCR